MKTNIGIIHFNEHSIPSRFRILFVCECVFCDEFLKFNSESSIVLAVASACHFAVTLIRIIARRLIK